MRISSRAALACLLSLFVLGTAASADDVNVRFLYKGAVMTNVQVATMDQYGATLTRLPVTGDGIYPVSANLGDKLLFSVHQPMTGADFYAETMVTELGVLLDIDVSQPEPAQVANDDCVNAIPVAVPSLTSGTTVGATSDAAYPFCGTGITSPGVWYTFMGTGTDLVASMCENSSNGSADYDTKVSVYCLDCDPGAVVCVGGNDDESGCNFHSTFGPFGTDVGATYFVLVHGFGGATGNFDLDLIDTGIPSNDPVLCFPPPPEGACCDCNAPPFNCVVSTEADCDVRGGNYFGDDLPCLILPPSIVYDSFPGLPINAATPVVSDTITVPDSFAIGDVNIQLEISHTWQGDMFIDIEHLGLVQTIWAGVCGSNDNINATADDEGTETYCTTIGAGPANAVFYPPDLAGAGPLSIYDGLDVAGDWTLTITDTFPYSDDGVLNGWGVVLPSGAGTPVCPDQNNESCFLCGVGGDDEDEDGEGGGGNIDNRDLTSISSGANSELGTNNTDHSVDASNTREDRRKLQGR